MFIRCPRITTVHILYSIQQNYSRKARTILFTFPWSGSPTAGILSFFMIFRPVCFAVRYNLMKPMRTAFSVHAKKNNNKKIRQRKHLTKSKEFLISILNDNQRVAEKRSKKRVLLGLSLCIYLLDKQVCAYILT